LEATGHEEVRFCGVACGLTEELFRFWTKQGMRPVFVSPDQNAATGEHTIVFLRSFTEDSTWLDQYCAEFRRRLGRTLGFAFRSFSPRLCDAIYAALELKDAPRVHLASVLSQDDIARLQMYVRKQVMFSVVEDLIPRLAECYFERHADVKLTRLMRTVLVVIGWQHIGIRECAARLGIEETQLYALIEKLAAAFIASLADRRVETDVRVKSSVVNE
jgi:tRNA(Met) C34 N-acetyltransferase TmcA